MVKTSNIKDYVIDQLDDYMDAKGIINAEADV